MTRRSTSDATTFLKEAGVCSPICLSEHRPHPMVSPAPPGGYVTCLTTAEQGYRYIPPSTTPYEGEGYRIYKAHLREIERDQKQLEIKNRRRRYLQSSLIAINEAITNLVAHKRILDSILYGSLVRLTYHTKGVMGWVGRGDNLIQTTVSYLSICDTDRLMVYLDPWHCFTYSRAVPRARPAPILWCRSIKCRNSVFKLAPSLNSLGTI